MELLWQAEIVAANVAGCAERILTWLQGEKFSPTSYQITDTSFATVEQELYNRFIDRFAGCCRSGDVVLLPVTEILRMGMTPAE